jgi:transcriptional regulator with XRE-family HTH domain
MKQVVQPHLLNADNRACTSDGNLVKCLGLEIKKIRKSRLLTVTELTELAGLSSGFLSKIENGVISPPLNTLKRLAGALDVSVPDLFFEGDNHKIATFVPAGRGVKVRQRGSQKSEEKKLLGRGISEGISFESFITTIDEVSAPNLYAGTFFLHMLEGCMDYSYDTVTYTLTSGDSLFFDAEAVHGPKKIIEKPVCFLSVIAKS